MKLVNEVRKLLSKSVCKIYDAETGNIGKNRPLSDYLTINQNGLPKPNVIYN